MNLADFNIYDRKLYLLGLIFLLFYFLSYLGYVWPIIQMILFWFLVGLMISLIIWRLDYAILFFIVEFLFGQAGHFFEWRGLSIRLILFVILMSGFLIRKLITKEPIYFFRQSLSVSWLLLFLVILLAIIRGYWFGHQESSIIGDGLSYFFLLLIFPLSEFLPKKEWWPWLRRIFMVALIGVVIFTIFNLFIYSAHLSQVHDQYYWWLRKVLVAKITDIGQGFFRIVLPAHLWVLPLILLFLNLILKGVGSKYQKVLLFFIFIVPAILSLVINFSRAYFLGLFVGYFFLKFNLSWRKWVIGLLLLLITIIIGFNLIYWLATEHLAGINFLWGRLQTIGQPEEELSALIRLRILPNLFEQIDKNLVFGVGLGASVLYLNPLNNILSVTTYIDWGWLEIFLELGLMGLLIYLLFLGQTIYRLIIKIKLNQSHSYFSWGALAGLIALMVASITGPFIFHPIGIFYQLIIISFL